MCGQSPGATRVASFHTNHVYMETLVLAHPSRAALTQVTNCRAWAGPRQLTPAVRALCCRPLHVQGWDSALTKVGAALHTRRAVLVDRHCTWRSGSDACCGVCNKAAGRRARNSIHSLERNQLLGYVVEAGCPSLLLLGPATT